jgi:hypothetical protein
LEALRSRASKRNRIISSFRLKDEADGVLVAGFVGAAFVANIPHAIHYCTDCTDCTDRRAAKAILTKTLRGTVRGEGLESPDSALALDQGRESQTEPSPLQPGRVSLGCRNWSKRSPIRIKESMLDKLLSQARGRWTGKWSDLLRLFPISFCRN